MPLAKLTRPRARGALARPRLFRLLDRERHRRVTWIWGPPGAGKTTLAASYLGAREVRALWYQLDEGDDDLASFFFHLRLVAPRRAHHLPLLTPEYLTGLAGFARRFFRELYARLRPPFVLVLDNFQDVSTPAFHEVVREGLTETPEGGRVLVLSRARPPEALARLRASQSLALLDPSVLRLTPVESRRLGRRLTSRRLSRGTLDTLHAQAGGWAAGMVLLVERLRRAGSDAPSEGLVPEATFDYFAGEILARTSRGTRDVLLQAALPSRIPARVVVALTGKAKAADILVDLHRRNYFTDLHAGIDPVYEFHPLFRAFLRARAETTYTPEQLSELRRRAAALLEQSGQIEEAAGLYREAGDWDGLARLVEARAGDLFSQGRWKTVGDWLAALPDELVDARPWLLYWRAQSTLPRDPARAIEDAARAFEQFRAHGDVAGTFLAWAVRTDAMSFAPLPMSGDRITELEALLDEGLAFPSPEIEARVVEVMTGALTLHRPAHPANHAWIARAEMLARASQDPDVRVSGLLKAAFANIWAGRLREAGPILETVRDEARAAVLSPQTRAFFQIAQTRMSWLTGDFVACRKGVTDGLKQAKMMGGHILAFYFAAEGVSAALSEGNVAEGRVGLAELSAKLTGANPDGRALYHFLTAWDALLRGDVARATGEVSPMLDAVTKTGVPVPEGLARVLAAQVHHEAGHESDAWRELNLALELVPTTTGDLVGWPAALAKAQFHLDAGREAEGLGALRRAMALGQARGYVNCYGWRSAPMARLCARALEAGIEPAYVRGLIHHRRLAPPSPVPRSRAAWPWSVEIRTLGGLEVRRDGAPLAVGAKVPRKPFDLLRSLIAFGPDAAREADVTEALWPDSDGDAAQRALATTLFRLRRLLGRDDAVIRRDGRLGLDPRVSWVDVRALEAALDDADAALRDRHASDPMPALEAAVALYTGTFLDGDSATWTETRRDRLRGRVVRVLAAISRRQVDAQAWDAATEALERALEIQPTAEDCCRLLMECLDRLGRPAAALATFERCRTALATEAGVAPAPATVALHRILRERTA
jgi:DNA-binding SARP family transcriptional activator